MSPQFYQNKEVCVIWQHGCVCFIFFIGWLYVQTVNENDLITAQMICGLTKCTTARLQTAEEVMRELFFDSHSTINDLVCIKNIACGRCSVIQHTMTRLDLLRLEHFSRMCTWQVGGNIYFIRLYLLKYHSRGCRLVKRGSVGPNKDCLFLYYPPKKADWRDPHILSITHWASCSHRKWVVHLVYK